MTSAVRGGTHWQHHNRWEDDGYREIHLDDDHDRRRPSPEREIEEEEEEDEMIIEDASSMSSSPSIPDENINFDLVYALHTFVATVEGQASVVKGDALILMEDTNIYWWLVEVLKTREVGYIPAENIETPYERLARLNKHRNVEITSPSEANEFVQLEKKSRKNVTIATGAGATRVIHYEVESEEEFDESGAEEEHDNDDDEDDDDDAFEDAHQDIIEESPQVHQQQYNTNLLAVPEQAEPTEELRVFAGNIGQAPLFHTFSISLSTTADVLVREAATRFDLYSRPEYAEGTIEYYIAVQGLDGDDYVLAPQDKPLSIFKTLTAPLTTPMPSVSHIRRTSPQQQHQQQQQPGIGGNSAAPSSLPAKNEGRSRRPRSSSFSNYEQTSYDEDSVIRFYLHRRIKRAHEREGIFYIKVSLYPDEGSSTGMPPASTNAPAFTTNPTPASSTGKKKKLISSRQEIDRIDKIMAVKQEQQIGSVITMALEKFHVPDAEAEGYFPQQAMMGPTDRCLTKYRMSVRANGIETRLDPRDHMASALHKQQAHGPVTSDLLFIMRRADELQQQQEYPPPLLSPVGGNKFNHDSDMAMPEERRPSILDILMDSPRSTEDRRPSFMKGPMTPVDDRRPSLPSSLATSSSQEQQRKSSLTPPCQQGATLTPPPISGFRRTSVMSGTSSVYSDCPATAMDHSSSWDGLAAPSSSSSSIARSASLQPGDAATVAAQQMQRSTTSTNNAKKESSFKQQLKRLVGWGSKSKKSPLPPLESPSSNSLMMMQQNGSSLSVKPTPSSPFLESTASQVSIVSAPPTPLTPTPGKNVTSGKALSPRRADHPPATPIKDRPHLSPVAAAASASATSMIDPAVANESHVSSLSSLSSDDDDDDVEVGKETVDLSDDSDDSSSDEDEEEDKPPKPPPKGEPLSDIQAQYAMWMDSQKSDQPGEKRASKTECEPPSSEPQPQPQPQLQQPEITSSPSSTLTTSSNTTTSLASTSCTSSNNQNNNTATNDKEDENPAAPPAAAPHPAEPAPGMDDLYLLVTRGVDFLQSRESSKWDDEGGYEFHPWNRPDGSFAVRKKSQVSLVEEAQPQQQPLPVIEQPASSEDEEDKASSTNSTKNEENPPQKERSNSTSSKLSSSRQQQARHPAAPPTQNEALIDEQELQRIVAAHIVF